VQNAPAQLLFKVVTAVGNALSPLPSSTDPWQPVIDGTFLTDFPTKLLAAGKFVKVPTIIGFTTDELTYAVPTNLNLSSDTLLAGLAELVLPFVPLPVIEELLALDPLSLYPNRYSVGGTEWKRATEIASDIFERCPGREFVRNMSLFEHAWRYRWNAALPAQIASTPEQGIVHASDIPYIFGPSITPYINAPLDIALSLVVQKAWISFAAHLSPNTLGDLAGVHWPKYHISRSPHPLLFPVICFKPRNLCIPEVMRIRTYSGSRVCWRSIPGVWARN
jgi:carboxylesterase type B